MVWTPTIADRQGPLFQRIVGALADDIAAGRLHHGQALPPQRALAKRLGVDLTTVTRAYAEARRLGMIAAHVGRGTFVTGLTPPSSLWQTPGIDLSMNLPPHPANADIDDHLIRAIAGLKAGGGLTAYLNYQHAGGSPGERQTAARWLRPLLPGVTAERLLLFPGTQSALSCLLMALAKPGDTIATEVQAYPGLKAVTAALGLRLVGLEMDEEGMLPDALDRAWRREKPRAVVLTPTMHNPTTATMSPLRRKIIADIIRRRQATLIEDDPYMFLAPGTVPIAHLVPERTYLAASLSKAIAPGLRTSLLVTPVAARAAELAALLRATMQMAAPLMTAVAATWMNDGTADKIIKAVRAESSMRQKLAREVLQGVTYATHPDGYHLWLPLPDAWSRTAFEATVRSRGLAIVTGDAFATATPANAVRVALGAAENRSQLKRALEILCQALSEPPPQQAAMGQIV